MYVSGQEGSKKKDFFISHNSADIQWAKWIAWQLEEEGYTVVLQPWDFRPGHNVVLEKDNAIRQAEHTLAVLSPAYLNGPYTQPEWAEAVWRDPRGEEGRLIPVLVQECEVAGLLGPVIPIHLVDKSERVARQTLLAGVTSKRAKPEVPPSFPSDLQHAVPLPKCFPGTLPRHTDLPPYNPLCIGRDQILEEAHRSLNAGGSIALTQPSEIDDPSPTGKSQVAREYVYRYQSDYHDVFWLNARSHSSLLDDFKQIAHVLTLPESRSNDQQLLIATMKNWFDTHTDWLLVFDAVEDEQQIQPFLPQSNNGHILLTCRVLSPGSTTHSLELPVSRPEERELIQRLARTVGGSLTGPFSRNVLDLHRPTTIGRDPNNTLVLNDPAVAPYHAEIRLTRRGYTLRNLDARDSTIINNQPLHEGETRVLAPNTTIVMGNTTLLYRVDNRMQPGQGIRGFSPLSRRAVMIGLAVGLTGTSILGGILWKVVAPSPTRQQPPALHDSMFGFDAQHTHNNPSENKVRVSNVSQLHLAWKFPIGRSIDPPSGNYPISQSSPVVANGIVYIGSENKKLYAIDAHTGQKKWEASTGDRIDSSPAIVNGAVYVGSTDGHLYAIDARTGNQQWKSTNTGNRIDGSPIVANGVVYVGSTDGHLYAIDARTGNQQWKSTDTGSSTFSFSSPAVANGVVYIGSWDGNLRAFDAMSGQPKWLIPINGASPSSTKEVGKGGTFSSPTIVNGVVYIGSQDGNLYAFDAGSGEPKWKASTGGRIDSSPAVANGTVYIGSADGNLYAFDTIKGPINRQPKWAIPADGPISSSPTVANNLVYIGSDNNKIYAFNTRNGHREWSALAGNSSSPIANVIYSSPTIADGMVYIGSTDGNLYAFSLS